MKLKLITRNQSNLIPSVKIQKALSILLDNSYNISEIAFKVGYNDPKYFTKCFRKELGISPTKYREFLSQNLKDRALENQFIINAMNLIEDNLDSNVINIDQFASNMNVSKSTLYRKIKLYTSLSPLGFIQNIRIRKAEKLLSKNNCRISEVAYKVGFSDPKYFSRCFKLEYGVAPSEFQDSLRHGDCRFV
jgi:AraC-like DNA-binding protein